MPVRVSAVELRPLRYPATCVCCEAKLPAKTRAVWDKERKEATCEPCVSGHVPEFDRGTAGASAAREARRRRLRRETRIRSAHPKLGGLILAVSDEPQSTKAWDKGAEGEDALGASLDLLRAEGLGVLHDRRIPGTKANIDHIVIGPAGVFVIDAKHYRGKVERRDKGSFFTTDWRLYVAGRDQSKLVKAMPRQVEAVRLGLAPTEFFGCRMIPVLCFLGAEWGLFARPFAFDDVRVLWPKELRKFVRSEGPLGADEISQLERAIAAALPIA
jgi:hypothetical protein